MRDRTAQTEPLTIGQQLVARWEGPASGWSEPADLAQAIDAAIAAEREACAQLAEGTRHVVGAHEVTARAIAENIRNRNTEE
jgi:RNase adaptor protein for sRNA GlmZ degradation